MKKQAKKSKPKLSLSGDTTEVKHLNGVTTYLVNTPNSIDMLKEPKYLKGEFPKSIDDFLEKKKNEIPLYDPYTGEPNPYYESLTNKKNPLLDTPKMLNPQIKEAKLKNRFLVYLPKDFGVDLWDIKYINIPTISLKPKKILGFTYGHKKTYNTITVEFNDVIVNKNKNLLKYLEKQEKFSFYFEELDPTGAVVDRFDFYDCTINYINFGDFCYKRDEINKITLFINVGRLEIK